MVLTLCLLNTKDIVHPHLPHCPSLTDHIRQICHSVKGNFHITGLLHELARTLEKWFKTDLKTPLALAVRFTFLISPLFILWSHCSQL